MQSTILSRRDLEFLLYEWLNVEALTQRERFADHSRETFDAALDTCERIATDLFAPHCKKNDQQEPHFDGETVRIIPEVKTALDAFGAAGLTAAGQDYELGGKPIPGVKGISLFIVPKRLVKPDGMLGERNDVVLAGLNHKMGHRGTTNCLLNFGEGKFNPQGKAGAIGYLVGEPHKGLGYMFHMMNEARIGVGLGAVTLGYTGYLHALDYARNRPQGRHPQAKDPAQPQIPIVEHADVKRMLLAQKTYVEGGMALVLYAARLVDEQKTAVADEERVRAGLLLEILTPIVKSWPSQWCLEANNLAIQVHGGYGYTREYNVEQFYRDNRLNAIHEGTHGIHGLDLLGRKVSMQNGAAFKALGAELQKTIVKAMEIPQLADHAKALAAAAQRIEAVTKTLYGAGDLNKTLANSSVYLEAFGHIVVAWLWLEQAMAAVGKDGDFYKGKQQACAFFFKWELPKVHPQLDLLETIDTTALDMQDRWF